MKKLYKVKKSNIDKNGLYAAKDIKAGTRIIEYVGKIISKKETERNDKFDNGKDIYLFNLNNKFDLDGDFKWNTARLVNHSCDPNCEVEGKGFNVKFSMVLQAFSDFGFFRTCFTLISDWCSRLFGLVPPPRGAPGNPGEPQKAPGSPW